jgi:hypothetical protein
MFVRVIVTIVLGFALASICGGTSMKAAIEIDKEGFTSAMASHAAQHETHDTKQVEAEHGRAKKTSNDGKVSHAVEIDKDGVAPKMESHEAQHETHDTKQVESKHGHAKKTSNDGKESHPVQIAKDGVAPKMESHEAKYDTHDTKQVEAEHGHATKARSDGKELYATEIDENGGFPKVASHEAKHDMQDTNGKESHKSMNPQRSGKMVHGRVMRMEHEHAGKEQRTHASLSDQSVFSDEEDDDIALDNLEAMVLARTFDKKKWGPPAAVPCTWNEWENDGSCAYTCGGRGKTGQKLSRSKNPSKHNGKDCDGKSSKQVECAIEECPTTTTTTEEETTTTAGGTPRMANTSSLTLLASLLLVVSTLGESLNSMLSTKRA